MSQKIYRGIGVMTGTSLDGADIAYTEFRRDGNSWEFNLLLGEFVPFDEKWYGRLFCLADQPAEAYARTHVYFGHFLGKVIRNFVKKNQLEPDFTAVHGQTIFHQPEKNFTAQIGDGETIAAYLNNPLVTNFRNKNIALGGQGAPLVPFGEKYLFGTDNCYLNLGGFANITCDDAAWDVVPCNTVLNWLSRQMDPPQPFDTEGRIAASGNVDPRLMQILNEQEYYRKPPPKSLGTEWVDSHIFPLLTELEIPVENKMHTFSRHIAIQVGTALKKGRHKSLMITGGGIHNSFLRSLLEDECRSSGTKIIVPDKNIINFKEAIIFAFLGLQVLLGKPNIMARQSGSVIDTCGGSIHLPPGKKYSLFR